MLWEKDNILKGEMILKKIKWQATKYLFSFFFVNGWYYSVSVLLLIYLD